jgi:hypothetical protein
MLENRSFIYFNSAFINIFINTAQKKCSFIAGLKINETEANFYTFTSTERKYYQTFFQNLSLPHESVDTNVKFMSGYVIVSYMYCSL